jgi:hypothetical protein
MMLPVRVDLQSEPGVSEVPRSSKWAISVPHKAYPASGCGSHPRYVFRVETVIDYYERWMAQYPDVASLAAGSDEDVNALWAGAPRRIIIIIIIIMSQWPRFVCQAWGIIGGRGCCTTGPRP